uniref:Uncharacterized protein n=1 Tax=Rhizophagus irregularis (strain DAOM 181602 / DAOM 197198 / MUCL 43194) TaxID=747089 RepID=U9TEQ4_RHIID
MKNTLPKTIVLPPRQAHILLALRIPSGPALCNAGQLYSQMEAIYMIFGFILSK